MTMMNAGAVARTRAEHEHERNLRGTNEPAAEDNDDARANADYGSFLWTGDLA